MQGRFLTNRHFHSKPYLYKTVQEILLVSFAVTLNHRQTFLLHIKNLDLSYIVQNHSGIVMFTYSIYEYKKKTTAKY